MDPAKHLVDRITTLHFPLVLHMPATRKRRTRSKAPSTDEIVAPGGGTQKDVNHLASNLGLESSAVAALLNCQGEGVAAVRSSTRTSGGGNGTKGDNDKPVLSAAWSDFMSAEGYDAPAASSTTVESKEENAKESDAKRAKVDQDKAQDATTTTTTTPSSNDSDSWEYQLPIRPLMRPPSEPPSSHVYPTPGLLAQTGTLDSVMVGRTKRPLVEPQDLQEPTLLTPSVFDAKVALIASAPSAAHSICILETGVAYAWGRNEMGQCGLGTTSACVPLPTKIELKGKFVGAAVGKSHSILIDEDGVAYGVGSNKCGQCGVNSSMEAVGNWKKCVLDGLDVGEGGEKESVQLVQVGDFKFFGGERWFRLVSDIRDCFHGSLVRHPVERILQLCWTRKGECIRPVCPNLANWEMAKRENTSSLPPN